MNVKTLKIIGKRVGLNGCLLDCYVEFMKIRFPTEKAKNYCQEWAIRIKAGYAYNVADAQSKKALMEAVKKSGISLKELCAR